MVLKSVIRPTSSKYVSSLNRCPQRSLNTVYRNYECEYQARHLRRLLSKTHELTDIPAGGIDHTKLS